MKPMRAADKTKELSARPFHIGGLSQMLSLQIEHLIGAYDEVIRIALADRGRLGNREAERQIFRRGATF
jgi:hypothetical protein